jgi:hypothetical protein
MGSYKAFLLQIQPNLVSHLKLVWHPMLIMVLLVLSIGFMQNILNMLAYVLNLFNKLGGFFSLKLNMEIFCLCGCKGKCDINGIQWLKSHPHLKGVVVDRAMERFVVVFLNIRETLIPCALMLRVVHMQDIYNHPIDDLCLAIIFGVEGNGFGELGDEWLHNGGSMKCGGHCENVRLQIGQYNLKSHMFSIDMDGCDIVLGDEWLHNLGPITMDFKDLTM